MWVNITLRTSTDNVYPLMKRLHSILKLHGDNNNTLEFCSRKALRFSVGLLTPTLNNNHFMLPPLFDCHTPGRMNS